MIASGVSVFGIPFITSENQGVILTTIFGGINTLTFNSFGCTSIELYPTRLRYFIFLGEKEILHNFLLCTSSLSKKRSTAMGIQYVAGRLGAILGNLLFGLAVDASCYIPLMTITSLLISSGLLSIKLPESSKIDIN